MFGTGKKSTIVNRANHRPKGRIDMKAFLIKLLCSKLGWAVKLAASAIVTGITLGLSKLGIQIDESMRVEIATAAASLTYIALQSIILKVQLNGSEKVQQAISEIFPRTEIDRWNGPKDIARLEAIVGDVKARNDDGTPILKAIPTEPKP